MDNQLQNRGPRASRRQPVYESRPSTACIQFRCPSNDARFVDQAIFLPKMQPAKQFLLPVLQESRMQAM